MSDIPPSTTSLFPQVTLVSSVLADQVWNSIPVPLTPLLGRDEEIAQICALLESEGTRLLTLTGPGGVGKTRLAIEAATQIASVFAHGACFVALESLRNPQHIADTVAQALGLHEPGETPAHDTLMTVLRDRHLLLVLDNVEYVVHRCDSWLANLFSHCPLLQVLVTSRIPIRIDGEQRFVVPPLPLPTADKGEGVFDNAAVNLFAQRARAVNPDFILSTAHAKVVAEICRRLEGMPLEIELAASRVTVLSPPAILTRLSDRLTILSGNRRDAPDRHRTMRDAIAWSYDLLPPGEQALFRRLAVFVGGFTVDAAEAVGGPMAIDMVTTLVDHSLIRCLSPASVGSRMGMYETTRQFGLEQLIAHGEEVAAKDAHGDYFLKRRGEADWGMVSHAHLEQFSRLDEDHENRKAAMAWWAERQQTAAALKIAREIMWFHWLRSPGLAGYPHLDSVMTPPQEARHPYGGAKALAPLQGPAPMLAYWNRAELDTLGAVALAREQGDPFTVAFAFAFIEMGTAHSVRKEADARLAEIEESPIMGIEASEIRFPGIEELCSVFEAGQYHKRADAVCSANESSPSQVSAEPGPSPAFDAANCLTPRELDVLRLVADGLTNQEIADMLTISLRTVTSHVTHILTKLAVTSRTGAVSSAIRQGLI